MEYRSADATAVHPTADTLSATGVGREYCEMGTRGSDRSLTWQLTGSRRCCHAWLP